MALLLGLAALSITFLNLRGQAPDLLVRFSPNSTRLSNLESDPERPLGRVSREYTIRYLELDRRLLAGRLSGQELKRFLSSHTFGPAGSTVALRREIGHYWPDVRFCPRIVFIDSRFREAACEVWVNHRPITPLSTGGGLMGVLFADVPADAIVEGDQRIRLRRVIEFIDPRSRAVLHTWTFDETVYRPLPP